VREAGSTTAAAGMMTDTAAESVCTFTTVGADTAAV